MKSITRTALVLIAFLTPAFASASWLSNLLAITDVSNKSYCGSYLACLGDYVIYLINSIFVPVLFAIAFIVFLYGIAEAYIFSKGDEAAVTKGHKLMLWGLIGFAVMISVWGLVNVVVNTFGLGGFDAPPSPTSIIY